MRVFALSDIHVDFPDNERWLFSLSLDEYRDDTLILAGDVTHRISALPKVFDALRSRFSRVLYVPGNHDLWVLGDRKGDSLQKFSTVLQLAKDCGIIVGPAHFGPLSVVPLFAWYDYSFGQPSKELYDIWADYGACRWPDGSDEKSVTRHFVTMNEPWLSIRNEFVISFSHFLPRIDLMPSSIPASRRELYPVLGTSLLDRQIRAVGSQIHVYGHHHLNMRVTKGGVTYINNAFGYPYETLIAAKRLLCIFEM